MNTYTLTSLHEVHEKTRIICMLKKSEWLLLVFGREFVK